ncbi:hypothetical protein TELCIR_20652, partial [Teladorsagia circumcincta]
MLTLALVTAPPNRGNVNNYRHLTPLNTEVLYCVKQLQFEHIEEYWTSFWQPEDDLEDEDKSLGQTRLSQQQLFSLCTLPQIQHWIISLDLAFYQTIVDILVPDVLMSNMSRTILRILSEQKQSCNSTIPAFLTQSCRNFAKNAEHYLKKAMQGAPEIIQKKKIQAVKYMAQGLRRYYILSAFHEVCCNQGEGFQIHFIEPSRPSRSCSASETRSSYGDVQRLHKVFRNSPFSETVGNSRTFRVDMQQVQEQAGWVSGCDSLMVHHIHNAFKDNLQKMAPMEEWAEWLESIVDQILAKYHDKPVQIISEIGKQFLLNWSCYTSMLIRDLTLRSAGSFGSFHLIRLLTDEYMVYLIESRIAKAVNRAMITVISQ